MEPETEVCDAERRCGPREVVMSTAVEPDVEVVVKVRNLVPVVGGSGEGVMARLMEPLL